VSYPITGGSHRIKLGSAQRSEKRAFKGLSGLKAMGLRKLKPGGLGRKLLKNPMAPMMAGMGMQMSDNPTLQTIGTGLTFLPMMGGGRTPAAQRKGSPGKNLPSQTDAQRSAARRRYWSKQQGQKEMF